MSRNQRLSFLGVAAVIAVAAVVVLGAGGSGDDSTGGGTTAAGPTATPPARSTASPSQSAGAPPATRPKAEPQVPVLTAGAGQVTRLRFTEGDTIRFQVRHDAPEEVHVHGYDLKKDVRPGKPAAFSFPAGITGIFEVELEQSGTQLAELRVEPG